ncbi:LamG domain-containing protein, partial [bacterium]
MAVWIPNSTLTKQRRLRMKKGILLLSTLLTAFIVTNMLFASVDSQRRLNMLPNNLVAYYSFDGNFEDHSGNGHHGIAYGNIQSCQDRFGNSNGAFFFDGSNDFVEILNSSGFDNTDELTIMFWVKRIDKGCMIAKASPSSHGYWIAMNQDGELVYAASGKWANNLTGQYFSYSTWHHIAFVRTMAVVKIYVDGTLSYSEDNDWSDSIRDDNINVTIGCHTPTNYTGSKPPNIENFFNGCLDDIYFFNRALTETEIIALTQPTEMAHWKFDNSKGSTLTDISGNGNHGTVHGASWVPGGGASGDGALRFDGLNDYVEVVNNLTLDTGAGEDL